MWLTNQNILKTELQFSVDTENFAGEPIQLRVQKTSSLGEELNVLGKKLDDVWMLTQAPPLARGAYIDKKFYVESSFPLGFFKSWKYFKVSSPFYVFPGRVDHISGRKGQGGEEDFKGFKRWTEVDSIKSIHWKIYARTGLKLKSENDNSGDTKVLLKFSDTEPLNNFEMRLEQMSFWIDAYSKLNQEFGIELPSGFYSRSKNQTTEALKSLATAKEKEWVAE